ncbi:hypothetical protein J7J84_00945 [bacterium]|nr:hypothetical protein [bacterium]
MKRDFAANPALAVRRQSFIKMLHQYCIYELMQRGFTRSLEPKSEVKILTSHKYKKADVAVVHPTSGPMLIIGVRSQMSSLGNNFKNYFEMEVGEVSSIHERFPLCVVGLLYLHPERDFIPSRRIGPFDFGRAATMFSVITGREKGEDPLGLYEEIAYLKVDFVRDPPTIDNAFPVLDQLRIDDFFDKLQQKHAKRNFPLLS